MTDTILIGMLIGLGIINQVIIWNLTSRINEMNTVICFLLKETGVIDKLIKEQEKNNEN